VDAILSEGCAILWEGFAIPLEGCAIAPNLRLEKQMATGKSKYSAALIHTVKIRYDL
jgi:hypothetical protein